MRHLLIAVALAFCLGLGVYLGARAVNRAQPVQIVEPDGTTFNLR